MDRQEFERVARLEAQQRQEELEAQKGNPHFQYNRKEEREMKRLWVVDWNPGNPSVIPSPELCPDLEEFDVIVSDQFFAVVDAEYEELDREVSQYPYWRITGQPADGRWRSEGGDEVYIHNATLLDSEEELWNALGLKPQDFGGETWDEVDDDVVRDQVPSF